MENGNKNIEGIVLSGFTRNQWRYIRFACEWMNDYLKHVLKYEGENYTEKALLDHEAAIECWEEILPKLKGCENA